MTSRAIVLVLAAGACGPAPVTSATTPSNATAGELGAPIAPPPSIERACWLGADRCVIELDLDGDRRADRVEAVRATPCEPAAPDDDDGDGADDEIDDDGTPDAPCAQGLWITLATGTTRQVGAGVALAAPASTDEDLEPIPLDADLGGLRVLALSTKDGPGRVRWNGKTTGPAACDGDGLVLSGGDAAAVLCWTGGTAGAYHLGF
jgi:hypothetical protein